MRTATRPHVVIVGAGISGLAAARFVRRRARDADVTVLEGSPRIGGKLRLDTVAGVQVDVGAEAMLARRPEAVGLAREVGLGPDLVAPATTQAAIWSDGRLVPIPAGTVMGIPSNLAALEESGLLTPDELSAARHEPEQSGLPLSGDTAIGDLVTRRLGVAVTDRLVEPLLGGVYAGRANLLSLDATVPALGAALRNESSLLAAVRAALAPSAESAPDAPVFAGIVGGIGRLPGAVAETSGVVVRTNAMVRAIQRRTDDSWALTIGPTAAEESIDADAVIVAVPAHPAARLLRSAVPKAADALAEIDYASVGIVTLAYRAGDARDRLPGSGFLVPPSEDRLTKGATFSSRKWRWLADRAPDLVVLRGSIGRFGSVDDLQRDDKDLVRTVIADISAATGLDSEPIEGIVTRWGGALPQYTVGHIDRVSAIRAAVADMPTLAVCGAAYDGVGIPACIATAEAAAAQVVSGLIASGNMGA